MSNTTVEEIEIIVTAKVEEALREFNKMKPQLMKVMEEVSKEISKVDFKQLNNTIKAETNEVKKQLKSTFNPETLDPSFLKATEKLYEESIKKTQKYVKDFQNEMSKGDMQEIGRQVAQATEQVKQDLNSESVQKVVKDSVKAIEQIKDKLEEVKETNKENEIKLDISNEEALEQITQIEKEIESLQKKIKGKELTLEIAQGAIDKTRYEKQDEIRSKNPNLSDSQVSNRADLQLDSDSTYTSLVSQADKLNNEIIKYTSLLESAKIKLGDLKQYTSQLSSSQEKVNNTQEESAQKTSKIKTLFASIGSAIKSAFSGVSKLAFGFSKVFSVAGKIGSTIKKYTPSISNGMKSVLKYAAALFSIKSIYSTLSSSAQSWLSSQNEGAKQLSANIEYMKYAMGSVFAPVIEYVVNLVYQLMKAFQSVVYAMTGMNVFAKATASSMSSTANSANKASKSLSSIHSDINNVSSNENSSGSGSSTPSIDLSEVDTELTSWQTKLAEFFKPLVDSWKTYSPSLIATAKETFSQIGQLLESVGQSFINIFANGTVYSILENILGIIGNIAEAFANAWNYNGNGDTIIQNLADALNNLLGAINNVIQNPGFQEWLNNCSDKFREISEKLAEVDWQPLVDTLSQIGQNVGTLALDVLNGLTDVLVWFIEHPEVVTFILEVATTLTVLSTVVKVLSTAFSSLSVANIVITAIIVAATLLVTHWEEVKTFLSNIIQGIINIFTSIVDWIKENWQGLLLLLVNPFAGAFKLLYDNCEGFRNFIDSFVEKIKNFFKDLWNNIQNILSNIGNFFSNIFNSIGNVVSNVFNGMWNTIKNVINAILGGIESMANGIVWGVNKVIDVLNNLNVHIPDWIPVFGGKDIGFHINQMSTVSLPRLAKGNVAWKETVGIFGEYSGAQNDPEITSPRSIMYETFVKALRENGGNNNSPISFNLTAIMGNKKIGQIAIEDIKDIKRATGEDLEVIFS